MKPKPVRPKKRRPARSHPAETSGVPVAAPAWRAPLDSFFAPRSVAVVGATEKAGSVGRALVQNLVSGGFAGPVFPINPAREAILGIKAYPNLAALPQAVDLVVIATPAPTVPGIIEQCAAAGVSAALIISAGFKECGAEGVALEQAILQTVRRTGLRVVGPNCLGLMRPHTGLNATFASSMARPGHVAFISQSGALCTAILDWSHRENVGFSAFVSIGSMLDIGWGDLIDALGDDPHTRSIVIYMESIGDARSFLSAAREVALTKPIIVVKVGRTEAAARAAASHTGALTGSDDVLEAAFRRAGVLRVNRIEDLFDMAEVLAKQPRPRGPRLAILTNAGGPGALAADRLVMDGGQLAALSPGTLAELNQVLPPQWSRANPVDVLGDADAGRFARALDLLAHDPANDGVLVVLTPQAMTDAAAIAGQLKPFAALPGGKPLLASWMGGPAVEAGENLLNAAGIPTFKYPDRAAQAFNYMWRYSANLAALYETPVLAADAEEKTGGAELVHRIVSAARERERALLTEHESKQVLAAYGIPTVESVPASTAEEAVEIAARIGYPVVVKLHSESLTHKAEVGGVKLNVRNGPDVREAWRAIQQSVTEKAGAEHFLGVTVAPMIPPEGCELLLGSSVDPQFGPLVVFGAGGRLVEIMADRAIGLPPLNSTLARRVMEQTKIHRALLGGGRRQPVDLRAIEDILVRFSHLVASQPWIREIDINPLFVASDRIVALDARVILHDPGTTDDRLPALAIRPYPQEYATTCTLTDGTALQIRPIRPEDEPLMVTFHEALSDRSVYHRYFMSLSLQQRTAHARLARICFVDFDREIALVALHRNPRGGPAEIAGVARLSRLRRRREAEFALVISDRWQRRGLGTRLLTTLIDVGRREGFTRISGTILAENGEMRRLCERVGFTLLRPGSLTDCEAEIRF